MPVFINEVIAEIEDPELSEMREAPSDNTTETQAPLEVLVIAQERQQRLLVD